MTPTTTLTTMTTTIAIRPRPSPPSLGAVHFAPSAWHRLLPSASSWFSARTAPRPSTAGGAPRTSRSPPRAAQLAGRARGDAEAGRGTCRSTASAPRRSTAQRSSAAEGPTQSPSCTAAPRAPSGGSTSSAARRAPGAGSLSISAADGGSRASPPSIHAPSFQATPRAPCCLPFGTDKNCPTRRPTALSYLTSSLETHHQSSPPSFFLSR